MIRDDVLVADDWIAVDDQADIAPAKKLIVSLGRWRSERDQLCSAGATIGVRLANTEDVDAIFAEIADRPLIALEFPKFDDGRALTQARVLRGRLGYRGTLRGVGDILQDLVYIMRRCGFNEILPRADQDPQGCLRALSDFSTAYQPAADGIPSVFIRRR
ncbi:MAG TPA: DUF934 domain-containing protein, partial [Stenotrophobium sp.]|nr:DUF934 domain-containing protein [Stenotrophobium sp.]